MLWFVHEWGSQCRSQVWDACVCVCGTLVLLWDGRAVPDPTNLYSAICSLEATSNSGNPVSGEVVFVQRPNGDLDVSVSATGLTPGGHGWHVHTYGDISDPTGMSVGGHFVGNCSSCRPAGQLQEVGLLDNGVLLQADENGTVLYTYVETVAKLEGVNSIVGRGLIIHGDDASSGVRVAQCVIGRESAPEGGVPRECTVAGGFGSVVVVVVVEWMHVCVLDCV